MEAGLGASAAVLGLAGGAAGLYRLVRPRFLYRVNCHFCCRDSMVGGGMVDRAVSNTATFTDFFKIPPVRGSFCYY